MGMDLLVLEVVGDVGDGVIPFPPFSFSCCVRNLVVVEGGFKEVAVAVRDDDGVAFGYFVVGSAIRVGSLSESTDLSSTCSKRVFFVVVVCVHKTRMEETACVSGSVCHTSDSFEVGALAPCSSMSVG